MNLMTRLRTIASLATVMVLAGALVACDGDEDETPTPSPTATATATETTPTATMSPTETGTASPTASATVTPADGSATTETEVVDYLAAAPPSGITPEPGECFSESLAAAGRSDTARCSVDNSIFDPCFVVDERLLECEPNPVEGTPGIYVEVEEPLTPGPEGEPQVWLLEVADGTVCGFMTGATGGLDGERFNYGCTNQEFILGFPEPGEDGAWTAEFVSGRMGPDGFVADNRHEEKIATAWR